MMVTGRAPYCVEQTRVQSTEAVLIKDHPVMHFNDESAVRPLPDFFGEMLAGLAEKLRVKQAVHTPSQNILIGSRDVGI
jgi:hypothetical protein